MAAITIFLLSQTLNNEKPGYMFKNITCLFKNSENSACVFSFSRIIQHWYFYLHKVQALEESPQTVEHIPAFTADDFMYKTGPRLSEFCRQQLPEETERSPV